MIVSERSRDVIDPLTGEVIREHYNEIIKNKSRVKGGWGMIYGSYDNVLMSMKSPKEIEVLIRIKTMFTRSKSEVSFTQSELADRFDISRMSVSKIIKRLVQSGFIYKVSTSSYIMNPYMVVPYQADGAELQEQWDCLTKGNENEKN